MSAEQWLLLIAIAAGLRLMWIAWKERQGR